MGWIRVMMAVLTHVSIQCCVLYYYFSHSRTWSGPKVSIIEAFECIHYCSIAIVWCQLKGSVVMEL